MAYPEGCEKGYKKRHEKRKYMRRGMTLLARVKKRFIGRLDGVCDLPGEVYDT